MLVLWRFLIGHFLKVTALCVTAFIAVLLTMRLDEIAHVASLGAQASDIALFALHQIPYIFPIALPIACLISSMILVNRLSKTHELTALRGSGMGLKTIFFPLLLTAAFLAMVNFAIVSEVATQSHLATNTLKSQLRAVNPLLLLHNKHLMRLKGVYFKAMGPSRVGEFASDVILAMPNKHNDRIFVITAKQLTAHPTAFVGKGITLLSVLNGDQSEQFDPILIENIEQSSTDVVDFADLLQKQGTKINGDYLRMAMLSVRLRQQHDALAQARQEGKPSDEIKELRYQYHSTVSELMRRISVSLAVFTFTLMGCAFGMSIGRQHSHRSLYIVIALATLFVVAFFTAKGLDRYGVTASLLYLVPHGVIILASVIFLNRITKGIEA